MVILLQTPVAMKLGHCEKCKFWLLFFALATIWMVFFLFCPEDRMSLISKNNLKC